MCKPFGCTLYSAEGMKEEVVYAVYSGSILIYTLAHPRHEDASRYFTQLHINPLCKQRQVFSPLPIIQVFKTLTCSHISATGLLIQPLTIWGPLPTTTPLKDLSSHTRPPIRSLASRIVT